MSIHPPQTTYKGTACNSSSSQKISVGFYLYITKVVLTIFMLITLIIYSYHEEVDRDKQEKRFHVTNASLTDFSLYEKDTQPHLIKLIDHMLGSGSGKPNYLRYNLTVEYNFMKKALDLTGCESIQARAYYGGKRLNHHAVKVMDGNAATGSVRIQGETYISREPFELSDSDRGVFDIKVVFYMSWIPYTDREFGGYVTCDLKVPLSSSMEAFKPTDCKYETVRPPQSIN